MMHKMMNKQKAVTIYSVEWPRSFLFLYSVFSNKSPTSQYSTFASMTRYSA